MRRICACLALVLFAAPARANTVVQGMATLSGGYNTNPTGTATARGDWFDDIRPGLRLTSMFDRGLVYAQYTFDATLFANHGAASGYSNDLSLGALVLASPTTSVTLTAGVLQSQVNNVAALQASASAPVIVVPSGTQQFVNVRVAESVDSALSPSWKLTQTTSLLAFVPLDVGLRQSYDLNNLLELGRTWRNDALSILLRADYINYPTTTVTGGATIPSDEQLLTAASLRWMHDFGSFLSTEIMAGLLLALRADDGTGRYFTPVGRAALHYRRKEGSVDLGYEHTAEPSVFTGTTFVGDALSLHGALPLGQRSNMALSASLGYAHANNYNSNLGGLSGSIDVWLADLSWVWTPWREMSFFVRYSFNDQMGNPADPVPLPSFMRHLIMAGVTLVYPAQAAAPAGFRSSVRVDRSDAVDLPALHAPPEQKPR